MRVISLERILSTGTPYAAILPEVSAIFLHIIDLAQLDENQLRPLLAAAKVRGVPVVIDTDDDYFCDADYSPFDAALAPHVPTMRALMAQADTITVTGPYLQQTLAGLGPEVRVIPNIVDPADYHPRPARGGALRIGWSGGPTHMHDLTAILPAVARLQQRFDFTFVLFGMFDRDLHGTAEKARSLSTEQAADPSVKDFATFARALSDLRYEHIPSVAYGEFPERLRELDLDIGLCPVLDTHFNRCRSPLKFYQYAATGTVSLASDVPPYRGECSYVTQNTPADWERALCALITDPALRAQHLQAQQTYWRNHRTWASVRPLYAKLLGCKAECDSAPPPDSAARRHG